MDGGETFVATSRATVEDFLDALEKGLEMNDNRLLQVLNNEVIDSQHVEYAGCKVLDLGEEFDVDGDGENPVIFFFLCSSDGCNDGSFGCNGEDLGNRNNNDNGDGGGDAAASVKGVGVVVLAVVAASAMSL